MDGRMDRRMDGLMDGRMNESPPVFYRTSSPSGPLPKKSKMAKIGQNKIMKRTWKDYLDIFTPSGANQNDLRPKLSEL